MVQGEGKNLHHLPVAPGLLEKVLLQPFERFRQFGERRAITQSSRLALDHREIVAPIIDGTAGQMMRPLDEPRVFADDMSFGNNNDAVRISP